MPGRRQRSDNDLRIVGERGGDPAGPPRTREAEPPPNNLPAETSSFVGRGRELAEAHDLLTGTRLLTLTGAGGCGKTRLALGLARAAAATGFPDGVCWAGLASLCEPDLVPQAVARSLGVHEAPDRSPAGMVAERLGSAEALLVLDNCEHLIEACAALADGLIGACPNLKVLTTSREVLGVAGEQVWVVPPLSAGDAERLFAERASAASGAFAPAEEDTRTVREICERLDGIPLAIEFAASRTRALSVGQISARLDDRFRLLSGGRRTAMPRHRTLRAAMDWSHELLGREEKVLSSRLSVFSGGWALSAAEEICSGQGLERESVLDVLSGLVDKSLVVAGRSGEEARYRMLETVRRYAAEKLNESGEESEVRRRHAGFFLALAEEAEPNLLGPAQAAWIRRLEREHDNLRTALRWFGGAGDAEGGLRLAGALWAFWWTRGHFAEGRTRLQDALAPPGAQGRKALRAKVLLGLGALIHRREGSVGDPDARVALEESVEIYRDLGDLATTAAALRELGSMDYGLGPGSKGSPFLDESLRIERELGNAYGVALSLQALGVLELMRHDHAAARPLLEEALATFRHLPDAFNVGFCLTLLGIAACELGEHAEARSRFEELVEEVPLEQRWGYPYALDGLVGLAAAEGRPKLALRLAGAAGTLHEEVGLTVAPAWRADSERRLEPARNALGERAAEEALVEGGALSLEEALGEAMAPETRRATEKRQERPAGLTDRELEVLGLVAEGLTDAQVARRLYLSPSTVSWHLRGVYRKLGVRSRTAALRKATERGLL